MQRTYYHGSSSPAELHSGICLTSDIDAARSYGEIITVIIVEWDALASIDCTDLVDRDEQSWPGDDGDDHGADILLYDDEDQQGRDHDTVRLMTAAAVAAATAVQSVEADTDEYYDLTA